MPNTQPKHNHTYAKAPILRTRKLKTKTNVINYFFASSTTLSVINSLRLQSFFIRENEQHPSLILHKDQLYFFL